MLKHAGAEVNETLVPGRVNLSDLFTHAPEAFTEPDKVSAALTTAQQKELRKNKNQYTTGEDNLILRGVVSALYSFVKMCYQTHHILSLSSLPLSFLEPLWREGMGVNYQSI